MAGQRFGARWTYAAVGVVGLVAMVGVPLAPMLLSGTALFLALVLAQATLGLAQGPVFPVFASALERWFPQRLWALGNGLQAMWMNIGGAITPLLIVVLTKHFGWQGALLWTALPVAVVTVVWVSYARDWPRQHSRITAAELAELPPAGVAAEAEAAAAVTIPRMLKVIAKRDVLLAALSYLCMNYAFYLISVWSYIYLVQVRHFEGIDSGIAGMVPWLGAGIGAGIGGGVSDRLALRWGARWGYRMLPLLSLPLAGVMLLVAAHVTTAYASVAALAAAFGLVELNEGAYWAATMRLARADTGAATGVLNTGGNVGGLLSVPIVGYLSEAGSWNLAFATGTLFALLAAGLWLLIDATRYEDENHG